MRVVIVGAGAVGGLLGAALARGGHAVSFVARGDAVQALRTTGVTVSAPTASFATGPLRASADPGDLGAHDVVLVAVKAWQVAPIAPALRPLVGPDTLVVPLQNGVEAADHLVAALGDKAVAGGLCHVLATHEGPARVRYVGDPIHVTAGERAGGSSARVERLAEDLRACGVGATASEDIRAALWSKLLFVEPLGSVGAVTRSTIDVVRALRETRALLEGAMREAQAVARGAGVVVTDEVIARSLARIDAMPPGATASMHRDIVEGRPSELHEQTGAVVRFGQAFGVERPLHDFLFASLLPQARRAVAH